MAVIWTLVESSNIVAIGYEEDEKQLHVQFNSGAEYVYHDVPATRVQDFLDADSKGKYLNEHIKGKYEYEKVG